MARVKGGTVARARRKKVLKEAKGYFGSKHRLYKTAHEQLMHSGEYAFRDRRQNKRNFRKLWIARINAACREFEISYSKFINGLNIAGVTVNRKMLSELAIDNKEAFGDLVQIAKDALNGKAYTPKEVKIPAKKEEKVVSDAKAEKKAPAKKAPAKKEAAAKAEPAKKPAAKKTTAKKAAPKKETAEKKTTTKKAPAKKAPAKKAAPKKASK